jgi:AraC-like DNA-binding protein
MFRVWNKTTVAILLLVVLFPVHHMAAEKSNNYYALNSQNGMSSNCVLQMLQLNDGRMVVVTDKAVDVYDGLRFSSVAIDTTQWVGVPGYIGATHLFADAQDRLWMKQWGRLYCLNLRTMQWLKERNWTAADFFITSDGETWLLHGRQLVNSASQHVLHLPTEAGNLQDVVSHSDSVYTFFSTGQLAVYLKNGHMAYLSEAYDEHLRDKYANTSLVVHGADGCFYQVRTGNGGSVLQSFSPKTHQWHQLLTSATWMHTLTPTPTGMLYLTTSDGYLSINTSTGEKHSYRELHLPDGTTLTTGINTVWIDREGGIWLGTYNNGLLYTSPLSGIFDTQPIDIQVAPILTTIYLHGQPLQVGHDYDGHILLKVTPPYTQHLTFSHDQNSLAFRFSTMNYVRPRSTCYRYRFSGDTGQWHTLSADSASYLVDDKGVFYLPLVSLSPGDYTLEVMATTNPSHWEGATVRRITFTIRPPWWQTPLSYLLYVCVAIAAIAATFRLYQRRLQRKQREDMLLLRIHNLVEQVNQYEQTEAVVVLNDPDSSASTISKPEPTAQEKEFMARATQLVEQHITDPTYNVERLAADLCMERTGLYKRLTNLMQQPPVAFIRSIRLHRAAAMLQRGDMSVTEIAEHTGFCSTSYFSKCFQKEFGCKPSEYLDK